MVRAFDAARLLAADALSPGLLMKYVSRAAVCIRSDREPFPVLSVYEVFINVSPDAAGRVEEPFFAGELISVHQSRKGLGLVPPDLAAVEDTAFIVIVEPHSAVYRVCSFPDYMVCDRESCFRGLRLQLFAAQKFCGPGQKIRELGVMPVADLVVEAVPRHIHTCLEAAVFPVIRNESSSRSLSLTPSQPEA